MRWRQHPSLSLSFLGLEIEFRHRKKALKTGARSDSILKDELQLCCFDILIPH